jgi:hypothetical protein
MIIRVGAYKPVLYTTRGTLLVVLLFLLTAWLSWVANAATGVSALSMQDGGEGELRLKWRTHIDNRQPPSI